MRFNVLVCAFVVMIALLAASPAKSDPVWLIQGSSTITGTNACSPAPCTESFTFSLLFQWTNKQSGFPDVYTASYIPGSLESSFWGVAGSFAPTNNGITFCCVPGQYLPFYGDHGEIDLAFPISVDSPSITPTIVGSAFYSCGSDICPQDFSETGPNNIFPVQYIVELVPEPSTLSMTVVALGFLLLACVAASYAAIGRENSMARTD